MARPSKYPAEFRAEAVRLALLGNRSNAEIARGLGINDATLGNWIRDHRAELARGSDPLALSVSEREELRKLRRENAELRTEREILRKAAAYFAQETIRSAATGSSSSTETSMASSGSVESCGSADRASTPGRPAPRRRVRSKTRRSAG